MGLIKIMMKIKLTYSLLDRSTLSVRLTSTYPFSNTLYHRLRSRLCIDTRTFRCLRHKCIVRKDRID